MCALSLENRLWRTYARSGGELGEGLVERRFDSKFLGIFEQCTVHIESNHLS